MKKFLIGLMLVISAGVFGQSKLLRGMIVGNPSANMSIIDSIKVVGSNVIFYSDGNAYLASSSVAGSLLADGTVPLTANWDVGPHVITGIRFISDIATGTSPFSVSSTTVVTNLNSDLLDGESGAHYMDNTDTQDLGITGNNITLTNGGTADVSSTTAVTTNSAKVTNATHDGEVTGSGTLTIADDIIEASNLEATNSPSDEYVWSYDLSTGGGTWVANGGTGSTTMTDFSGTAWRVYYANTSGDVTELALGADGTYLKSNGASAAPTFDTPSGSGDALVANPLSQFASTTSSQLAGVISNETGTGLAVFGTSPSLTTPALGTPSALVGTNISGTAASLTAGTVTTNANLTGEVTSVGNSTVIVESYLEDGGASEIAVTSGMMNGGTSASSTTFWRGDNTWATPSGSGDMLSTNNLSELTNDATARTNIDVYSESETENVVKDSIQDLKDNAVSLETSAWMLADTVVLAAFSAIDSFNTSFIYGSFYNNGSDTLIVTEMAVSCLGTTVSFTVDIEWYATLDGASATHLNTTPPTITTEDGTITSDVIFNTAIIPPGVQVWVKTPTVTTAPTYLSVTLLGYRQNRAY